MNMLPALLLVVASGLVGVGIVVHPALALLPIVVGVAAAIATRPFVLLLAFVAVLYLRPGDFSPALAALQPGKLFVVGALGVFAAQTLLARRRQLVRSANDPWMLALTLAVLLSSLLSSDRAASVAVFKDVFLKILLLVFLMQNLLTSQRRVVAFQWTLGVLCGALGLYAVVMKATGNATIEGSRAALVGLLGDPNDLALILLMPVHFLGFAAVRSRGPERWAGAILGACCVMGIVATLSRGGMLALAAGSYFSVRYFVKSRLFVVGGLALGLAVFVVASGVAERKSGAVGAGEIDESAQGRLDAWKAGGRMVMRHPLLGVGLQRFADNFDAYSANPVFWGKHETHNSYIKAASETGLLGFIPFVVLVARTLWSGWLLRRRAGAAATAAHEAVMGASFSNAVGFFAAAFFLSQCWGWFFYILFALTDATHRTFGTSNGGAA